VSPPPEAGAFFLCPDFIAAAGRATYLPEHVISAAVAAARRITADESLTALARHYRHCLFEAPSDASELIWRWPPLTDRLQRDAGLFYLLVLLSQALELDALYQRHAIPEQVARETLFDIQRRLDDYRSEHGAWGLTPRHLTWLRNHLTGGIYHLVRLQFAPGAFRGEAHFFRHQASGVVLALSADGVRYRADGAPDGAGGVRDLVGAWTAHLVAGDDEVAGVPLTPAGRAVRHEVRLRRAAWQPALASGDPVLHIHIPAGSPMDLAACGESFAAALTFFGRHFPEQPFVAFSCSSWLLDPALQALLPATSNIARFQREVYLLPGRADGKNTLVRVFGEVPPDLTRAPRDTTLRRAMLDHLLAGGHLSSGRCVLFPEDLSWGRQVYLRQTWPHDVASAVTPSLTGGSPHV
jgi:hypothetical protein